MTNHEDSEDILTDQEKIEKVTEFFKYFGQTTHLNDTAKEDIDVWARAAWNCYGQNKKLPHFTQNSVMDRCVLPTMTYGCLTWALNRQLTNKLRTFQRTLERKMLNLQPQDLHAQRSGK